MPTEAGKDEHAKVVLIDRYNRKYSMNARPGQSLSNFLVERHIPRDAVIAYVGGRVVDDQRHILQPSMVVDLLMVRAYALPEFERMLGLWDADRNLQSLPDEHIYTKKVLWFNDNGVCELRRRSFTPEAFVKWLEDTFVESILTKGLISEGDRIVLALSGGRDSVALLHLLHRCRSRLPKSTLHACTVVALANALDLEIAQEIAVQAGVDHWERVMDKDIESIFRLKVPYREAIDTIFREYGRAKSLYVVHHIMRTGVESYMRRAKINTMCMGLHTEDLMAGVLWGTFLGLTFGESAAKKNWGPFKQIYPLWPITKKELTLYLTIVAPSKHSSQTAPDVTDRGDHNRDMNYFISDSLQTLWPGVSMQLFEGMEKRFERTMPAINHRECRTCHGFFLPERTQDPTSEVCHVCNLFHEFGLSDSRASLSL